ncbi:acyltransferase [Streptosporangium sp. NPDC051022]|uniref:acyltransferase family protein n=1 Tax=Streptosporangium sp. NPDC051022 TaxID=3155752 RepID=UPI003437992E
MRFIAAVLVFLFHAGFQGVFASPDVAGAFSSVVSGGGWTGVGFFFVLSGFVLTWSVRRDDTAPRFWRRRFFKIYPNHLLTFVVAFLLLTFVSQQVIAPGNAVFNLLLLQAWFPPLEMNQTVNTVSWSLSCELLFYLAFPLLIRVVGRIRDERLWLWAGAVIAVIVALPLVAAALPDQPALPWTQAYSQPQWWLVYVFPLSRTLDFVFGMLLARLVQTGHRIPLGLGGAAVLTVVAYAVAPLLPGTFPLVAVAIVPLGLLIAAGAVADVNGRSTWLSGRTMVWLGEISFAFYLWHRLVLVYGDQWIFRNGSFGTPVAIAVLLALFGITVLVSWLVFSLFERPIMRRFAGSRRSDATGAGTVASQPPLPNVAPGAGIGD